MSLMQADLELYLADALVILGVLVLTVGVYGVIRMPGTYLKLQAAGKMVFLGMLPLLVAAAATGEMAMASRAVLIAALLLLSTPISSHAITKAAYQQGEEAEQPNTTREANS